jgi:hypothetical protein
MRSCIETTWTCRRPAAQGLRGTRLRDGIGTTALAARASRNGKPKKPQSLLRCQIQERLGDAERASTDARSEEESPCLYAAT